MELGKRLRQARQEAGLSQRQLCGDRLTRNMLSQIENGSARPSMNTLQYFAQQLGKPVSFFLEEEAPALSPNQSLMPQLRRAEGQQVLELLADYREPDSLFDPERFLLEVLACLDLAQEAIEQGKERYAARLLEQAHLAGEKTPYYTPQLQRRRLLLCHRAKAEPAAQLIKHLPSVDAELLLRAEAALAEKDGLRCVQLLQAAEEKDAAWHFLMGQALFLQQDYSCAEEHLQACETHDPKRVYTLLEQCSSARQDYKMAYHYACKLRQLEKGNTSFLAAQDV